MVVMRSSILKRRVFGAREKCCTAGSEGVGNRKGYLRAGLERIESSIHPRECVLILPQAPTELLFYHFHHPLTQASPPSRPELTAGFKIAHVPVEGVNHLVDAFILCRDDPQHRRGPLHGLRLQGGSPRGPRRIHGVP